MQLRLNYQIANLGEIKMENKNSEKFLLTESTKKVMDELITENIENLDDHELVRRINETKKLVAKLTESGQIEVKMVLCD